MLFSDCLAQYAASTAQQFLYKLGRAPTITHVLRLPLVAQTKMVGTPANTGACELSESVSTTRATTFALETEGQETRIANAAQAAATSVPTGFRVWRTRGTDRRFVEAACG